MAWNLFSQSLVGKPAPDISGEAWFNTDRLPAAAKERLTQNQPLRFSDDLTGTVVLVDFWDYSCINCVNTLPYLTEWWRRYRQFNFFIIGVHTPEFAFAKDPNNVEAAVKRFGIEYPVVSDPEYVTWRRYENNVWPRELLVDEKGIIRADHRGEGAFEEKEAAIQKLLGGLHPQAKFVTPMSPVRVSDKPGAVCLPTTPEIYLGYERGQTASAGGLVQDAVKEYGMPDVLELHEWAVRGQWRAQAEEIMPAGQVGADILSLHYLAPEVFAVMRTEGQVEAIVELTQDGKPLTAAFAGEDVKIVEGKSVVRVQEDRLYRLVKNAKTEEHTLELTMNSPALALHTFTFGRGCD